MVSTLRVQAVFSEMFAPFFYLQGNFVLSKDELLKTQKEEYETILCLSITKWIHLNWGDDGLKRFFRRIFLALKPGGVFILEPQAWPSYAKKKKMTVSLLSHCTWKAATGDW